MMANMKSLSTKSKKVSSSPKYVQGIPAARPIIYRLNIAQAYHLSLVGFAHDNQGLELWAAVPILHQSYGIWGLSDTSQQQKGLRYIINTCIFFQMLQLKFGMPTATPQMKVIQNEMSKCVSIISDRNDELLRPLKVILALTDTNLVSATTVQPFYTTNTLEFNSCKHFSPVN